MTENRHKHIAWWRGAQEQKAHHNVGGLLDDLQLELCEPVKLLFKDEVPIMNFWFTTCKPCVGEPIMGGINSAEQREALNKLIDQALA